MQASAAGSGLLYTKPVPEAAFVSPLSRTLETATIAVGKMSGGIPIVAVEDLRERNGVHVCDKRSAKEEVAGLYPSVDFVEILPGPDKLFSEIRETEGELAARGRQFFLGLRERPETSFVVFTHSSFLYNTLSKGFEAPDPKGM